MNFTKHFKIKEFNCKDGTPVPPQYLSNAKKVADQLEVLRAALGGRPIIITSGYRTPEYNKKVGGVGGSAHLTASAADIVVRGIPPAQVAATIEKLIDAGKMQEGGIGIYKTFVHYDIRGTRARWDSTKKNVGSTTGITPALPADSEGNEDQAGEQLTPTTPDSPPANDDKKNYTPYLIAAGVLVLGGIGYYIYKKK